MKKIFNHPEAGEIELCVNPRCKGIKYSVSANRVRVSFNPFFADKVLPLPLDKVQWILKCKEKFKKAKSLLKQYLPDTEIDTLTFKIKFVKEEKLKNTISSRLENKILLIKYPPFLDFENISNQLVIKNIVKRFLTIEAKRILPEKLNFLGKKYNFTFSEVKINSAKSRWGSCNSKKRISLSCYLMFLPENLVDFILIHELCHTKIMSHNDRFYKTMEAVLPDYTLLNKQLKIQEKEIRGFI